MAGNFLLSAVKRADTSFHVMNANKVNQPASQSTAATFAALLLVSPKRCQQVGWTADPAKSFIPSKSAMMRFQRLSDGKLFKLTETGELIAA